MNIILYFVKNNIVKQLIYKLFCFIAVLTEKERNLA